MNTRMAGGTRGAGVLLLAALGSLSCRGAEAPREGERRTAAAVDGPGPALRLIDSVALVEVDSLPTGRFGQVFAVGPDGRMYFGEESRNQVLVYAPSGRLVQTIGRPGAGPGELHGIGSVFVSDSLVVVSQATRALSVFHRTTGAFLGSRRFRGYARFANLLRDTVVVGLFDVAARMGVVVLARRDLFAGPADVSQAEQPATAIPFPSEYARFPGLETGNFVAAVAVDGGVVAGYANGTDAVYYLDAATRRLDTLRVPYRLRTGNRPEGLELLKPGSRASVDRQFAATSVIYGLYRLTHGAVAVWNEDNAADLTPTGGLVNFRGRAYLAVLSADRTRVCTETEVPFPGTSWPRLTVLGDTLYAVDQAVDDVGPGAVRTVVRRYLIDDRPCRWESTAGRARDTKEAR